MATGNEILFSIKADSSELLSELNKANKKIKDMESIARDSNKSMTNSFATFGIAAKGYILELGAKIAGWVKDSVGAMIELAAELDTTKTAFKDLTDSLGVNGEKLVEDMKKASRGTIDESDLMKASLKALEMGGKAAADSLPALAEIAMATARLNPGLKAQQALEELLVATSTEKDKKLKSLGISTKDMAFYTEQYANTLGKTTKQLDTAQQTAAYYYAVTKSGADIIKRMSLDTLTLSEKLQVLKNNSHQLKEQFAEGLRPALDGVLNILGKTKEEADGTARTFRELGGFVSSALGTIYAAVTFFKKQSIKNDIEDLKKVIAENPKADFTDQLRINLIRTENELSTLEEKQMAFFKNNAYMGTETIDVKVNKKISKSGGGRVLDKLEDSEYYSYLGRLRDADIAKEMEGLQKLRETKGISQTEYAIMVDQLNRKIADTRTKYEIQANEYIGNFRDAELEKERLRYEELLRIHTGNEAAKAAIEAQYLNQKEIAEGNAAQKSMQSSQALMAAKMGLQSREFAGMQATANMGAVLMSAHNKKLFAMGKDLAYAQALMNGYQAITKAWSYGPILGPIFAVITALATGVQIDNIRRTKPPKYEKGRVPVFADGYIPNDHFLAYVGSREAVVTAEATKNNAALLSAMNANPSRSFGGEQSTVVHTVVNVDGRALTEVVDTHRASNAARMGLSNYAQRRSFY